MQPTYDRPTNPRDPSATVAMAPPQLCMKWNPS